MKIKSYWASALIIVALGTACNENVETSTDTEEQANTEDMSDSLDFETVPKTEVSEEEFSQFFNAAMALQEMNQGIQDQMIAEVEATGLSVEQFSQIQRASGDPQSEFVPTAEDQSKYDLALTKLESMQEKAQNDMLRKIEEFGLNEERYQEIGMAMQNDPEMMAKFQEMQQAKMLESGAAMPAEPAN